MGLNDKVLKEDVVAIVKWYLPWSNGGEGEVVVEFVL